MTSEQFAYWLQGFVEIHGESPTGAQWQIVKDHLATVFTKVTPQYQYVPSPNLRDAFVRDQLAQGGAAIAPNAQVIC